MNQYKFACLCVGIILISDGCFEKKSNNRIMDPQLEDEYQTAFIGTYTRKEGHVEGKANGIYHLKLNKRTGNFSKVEEAFEMTNPSFLLSSIDQKNLYAVSELAGEDEPTGFIYSFSIEQDFSLKYLDKLPTEGQAPCHIGMNKKQNYLFVANYVGGVVKMYKRNTDGSLNSVDKVTLTGSGPHGDQDSSHPHSATVSPDDKFVYILDKGSDKIWIFYIDYNNDKLIPARLPFISIQSGAGPRHFSFHPNLHFAYVINELDNTINAFKYVSRDGSLQLISSTSTLPDDFKSTSYCADLHIHPNGKYIYGSNRGHDSIVGFEIDSITGDLSILQHISTKGSFPRNFAINPSGNTLYVANQNSDNIQRFELDINTGLLSQKDSSFTIPTPVCIQFLD